jgi:hypothetical protein
MVKDNEAQGLSSEEAETKAAREHNALYTKRSKRRLRYRCTPDIASSSSGLVEDVARAFSGSILAMISAHYGMGVIGNVDSFLQISDRSTKSSRPKA